MNEVVAAAELAGNIIGGDGGAFVIAEWRDEGGVTDPPRLIAPLHMHHKDDEAWYVLKGALRIRRGDEVVEAAAGSAVFVPRGTPHTYWNAIPGPTRYLLVMTPRIHALIRAIHAMTERTPEKMRDLFRQYDSELLV
ncbi:MAG TPA: cupin domain-containing protein [Bryobacteraceae bacterium]|nr:cupin domain-containing protein [Bryobacteraceae bacterium]